MAETGPPRRRWMGILLGLSLAMNLLIIGAIIGALTFAPDRGRDRPVGELRQAGRLPVAAMLPREARDELRAGLRREGGRDRAEERARITRFDAALRADPFDPDAVAALLSERRVLRDARTARVDAVLVEVLTGLSPRQRVEFADRIQRRYRR